MANQNITDYSCLLKLSNNKVLKKFLHQCVDELVGKEHENFNSTMGDIEWSPEEHKLARNIIQNIYKSNVFEEDFTHQLNDLSDSHVEEVKLCFQLRKQDIYRTVMKEQLLKSGIPLVENIDWKLKWVMGSSKLASISEPLLQVDLNCITCVQTDADDSSVQFEVNLTQLDDLIGKLERVREQL